MFDNVLLFALCKWRQNQSWLVSFRPLTSPHQPGTSWFRFWAPPCSQRAMFPVPLHTESETTLSAHTLPLLQHKMNWSGILALYHENRSSWFLYTNILWTGYVIFSLCMCTIASKPIVCIYYQRLGEVGGSLKLINSGWSVINLNLFRTKAEAAYLWTHLHHSPREIERSQSHHVDLQQIKGDNSKHARRGTHEHAQLYMLTPFLVILLFISSPCE